LLEILKCHGTSVLFFGRFGVALGL
jgi:hypothetical protein